MKKTYILDTSALIHDPTCYEQFEDSEVIIPNIVLTELDNLKKGLTEAAKKARMAIKNLEKRFDHAFEKHGYIVAELDNNIELKIDNYSPTKEEFDAHYSNFGPFEYGDTQILICAYMHHQSHLDNDVTLVSNDICLRMKAKGRGVLAISASDRNTSTKDIFAGHQVVVDEEAAMELQKNNSIEAEDYLLDLETNESVLFTNHLGDGLAMGRKNHDGRVKLVKKHRPWGLSSRNKEQAFAVDLMMDKNIDLVTLLGRAGSGKTLLALACGLQQVLEDHTYNKLVIYRPIQAVGGEIGFTPGTVEEKLEPWFDAIMDSMEVLFSKGSDHKEGRKEFRGDAKPTWRKTFDMFKEKGKIEFQALTYVRGRSLPKTLIICDEVQNLPKNEIKTLLTRAGEGTKVILTGDIEQIDRKDLDGENNGLSYIIESFKGNPIAGHITLLQGERSRLATVASELLV